MAKSRGGFSRASVDVHSELRDQGLGVLEQYAVKLGSAEHQVSYSVAHGLTEYYAGSVATMAMQQPVREFYPADSTEERFATRQSTQQWLRRVGSKSVYLLLRDYKEDHRLAGYGWVERASSVEAPGGETKFAVRLGEEVAGKGFEIPFSAIILGASAKFLKARNFWLEEKDSNEKALKAFDLIGFEEAGYQPRISTRRRPRRETVLSSQLYMRLPDDKLANLLD